MTTATCPADPWTSGAQCQNQKIAAKGADPGPLLNFRFRFHSSWLAQEASSDA